MTTTDQATPLKPLDEPWMRPALQYIHITCKRTGAGPTWKELHAYMCWRRDSFATFWKMNKLARRGAVWQENVPRSLRLSEAGTRQLQASLGEARKASAQRRAERGAAA